MNIHFSSDTHFGHKNILLHTDRHQHFASVEEHDEALITNWNSKIAPQDTAYFLGDLSFEKLPQMEITFARLHGRKHLIRGNHDHSKGSLRLPWESIQDYLELMVNHQRFILSHYPFEIWNKSHHSSFHLHGHSHGNLHHQIAHRMDVGADCSPTYSPFSLEEIVEILSAQEFVPLDHHGE